MTDGQNRRMKRGAVESVGNILILVSVVTGFVSFVALFKPFPQESFFTRKRVVVVWVASFVLFGVGGLLRPVPSLGPFFMLVSILAGTCSFIALFQPLPQIWLPTRKRAAVIWVASFALVALGGSLISDLEEAETRLAAEAAAEAAQAEARLAEDARLAAVEERARLAAESFPTRREEFEQRLGELEGLVNDEAWSRAKNDGEALQQELLPLFRSSISETPEVVSIRTRLDDALGVARKEERALPRPTQLPEPERRRIFRLLVECQDRATARAETEFPEQDPLMPGFDRELYLADTQRRLDRASELSERCSPDVQSAEELGEDEMFRIRREGTLNGWPPL